MIIYSYTWKENRTHFVYFGPPCRQKGGERTTDYKRNGASITTALVRLDVQRINVAYVAPRLIASIQSKI